MTVQSLDADAATGQETTEEDSAGDADRHRPSDQGWSWHLTRVTGCFLMILVPIHFAVVMITNDVGHATAASMSQRLHAVGWRGLDWVLLTLAFGHGFFALRQQILGSRRADSVQNVLVVSVGVFAVLLASAASATLLSYS